MGMTASVCAKGHTLTTAHKLSSTTNMLYTQVLARVQKKCERNQKLVQVYTNTHASVTNLLLILPGTHLKRLTIR